MPDEPVVVAPVVTTPVVTPTADIGKTFTQAQLDAILTDRLGRANAKFADYDTLKAKADKQDAADAANQSDLQKAIARAEAAEKLAGESTARLRTSSIRQSLTGEALKAGAVDADTVVALIDASKVNVTAEGDVTNAAELVAALLTAKPFLAGKPAPTSTGFDGGARPSATGAVTKASLRSMTPQQIAALDPRVIQAALAAK